MQLVNQLLYVSVEKMAALERKGLSEIIHWVSIGLGLFLAWVLQKQIPRRCFASDLLRKGSQEKLEGGEGSRTGEAEKQEVCRFRQGPWKMTSA